MYVATVDCQLKNAPREFSQSLRNTGFAILKNHPIDVSLFETIYKEWEKFFKSETKHQYLYNRETQQGYFPFRSENAKDSPYKNLSEFFNVYGHGLYPKEVSDSALRVYRELSLYAETLLSWLQSDIPEEISKNFPMTLPEMVKNTTMNLMRIIHYPPLEMGVEPGALRSAAHEDINLITLLPTASTAGLQVKDLKGNWHDTFPEPGTLIINAGDMLQLLTNHYYISTTHQVVNPANSANVSRISMPLFVHPNNEVRLSEDYTAGEYLFKRLRENGVL